MTKNSWIVPVLIGGAALAAAGYAYKQFKGDGIEDSSSASVVYPDGKPATFDSSGNVAVDKRFLRETGKTEREALDESGYTQRTAIRQSERTQRTQARQETIQKVTDNIKNVFTPKNKGSPLPREEANISLASGGSAYVSPQGNILKSSSTPIKQQSKLRKALTSTAGKIISPIPSAISSLFKK